MEGISFKFLLISGCPRSGTTFLNLLLNSHPKIAISNECNVIKLIERVSLDLYRKEVLYNEKTIFERSKSPRENWSTSTLISYIPKRKDSIKPIIYAYLSSIKKSSEVAIEIVGDKLPKYYKQDLDYFSILNDLPIKVIHITRDPIEVISSMMRRYANTNKGLDRWKAIESLEQGFNEWIEAWNWRVKARESKQIELLDLNYNKCIKYPNQMYVEISRFLEIDNLFDKELISNEQVDLLIDQRDASKFSQEFSELAESWSTYPLLLNDFNNKLDLKKEGSIKFIFKKISKKINNLLK